MATIYSEASDEETVTLEATTWRLSRPLVEGTGRPVALPPGWAPTTKQDVGVFYPKGQTEDASPTKAVVVWGEQYGIETPFTARTLDRADFDAVKEMLLARETLLLQSIWGDTWYLAPAGDVTEAAMRAAPTSDEAWPLRHAFTLTCPMVEVEAP